MTAPYERFAALVERVTAGGEMVGREQDNLWYVVHFARNGALAPRLPDELSYAISMVNKIQPIAARVILRTALQGLQGLYDLTKHADPDVSALATEACEDETALFPLCDRLEELGLDASLLTCLLPPRPAPVVVEDESGIPY